MVSARYGKCVSRARVSKRDAASCHLEQSLGGRDGALGLRTDVSLKGRKRGQPVRITCPNVVQVEIRGERSQLGRVDDIGQRIHEDDGRVDGEARRQQGVQSVRPIHEGQRRALHEKDVEIASFAEVPPGRRTEEDRPPVIPP